MFGWIRKTSAWEWADKRRAENILRNIGKSPAENEAVMNDKLADAVKRNMPETVKALAKAGASADAQLYYVYAVARESYPVVSWAAAQGNLRMVQALADAGANLDKQDTHDGHTALIEAVRRGNTEMTRLLLDLGADTEVRTSIHSKENTDYISRTLPRDIALRHGFNGIAKMIDDEPARRRQAKVDAAKKEADEALRLKQQEEAAAAAIANKEPSVTKTGQAIEVMEPLKIKKAKRGLFT